MNNNQPVRYKQRDDDEHADLTDLENVSGSDGDEDIYEIVDWMIWASFRHWRDKFVLLYA